MPIRVWSEREPKPPGAGLTDCVWSSGLTVLEAAALPRLAHVDRNAERQALERSQTSYKPETGGDYLALDQATRTRYGILLSRSTDLEALLERPNLAIAVGGSYGRLPLHLRRWSPNFTGNHSAVVVTRPGGTLTWLDPLAPDKSPGEPIGRTALLTYWHHDGLRWSYVDRYLEATAVIEPAKGWAVGQAHFEPGTTYRLTRRRAGDPLIPSADWTDDATIVTSPDKGTWAHYDGPWQLPDGKRAYRLTDGYRAGYWFGLAGPMPRLEVTQVAPDAELDKAYTAGQLAMRDRADNAAARAVRALQPQARP